MEENIHTPRRGRAGKVALGGGVLAAGALAGAILAGTMSASADTTPSPAASSPATSQGAAGQSGTTGQSGTAPQSGTAGQRDPGGATPVRSDEKAVSAADAAKLKAAALAAVPGGTVYRVETDAGDGAYEAHMTKADGTRVTVKFDKNFAVIGVEDGMGKGDPAPAGAANGTSPQGGSASQGAAPSTSSSSSSASGTT